MEPIRILNMFTIMNRGGAETMVMNYYRNIDRSKVQFDFLVHRKERGAYDDEIKALGGRIYRMMPIYPQNFAKYKKQIKIFFENHNNYKIVHGHLSELGYFAYRQAAKSGIPVRICHAHNTSKGFDYKTIIRKYFIFMMKPYITDMFICGMNSGINLFGEKNKKNFIMQNNAIDSKKFQYDEKKASEIKEQLGIQGKFVIGHVGRFNVQKNHEFLIEIFRELYSKNNNAILVLVGSGNLEEKMKQKVKELKLENAVRFLGTRSDIDKLMQAFDVFLFPSLFEGLPVTLVEAQASGLKCIVSDGVPKESSITDLVEYHSLEKSAEYWADEVLKYQMGYDRKDMYDDMINSGFDIEKNAEWLQEFYLAKYKEFDKVFN